MGGGRAPCCDKNMVKRGPWSPAEDYKLATFVHSNGHHNWRSLPKQAGLLRCGKSCRLRWINYLSPFVKRGNFTPEEQDSIIKLHRSYGNKWSKIAAQLPGRTDNEIKNVWNTYLKKRLIIDKDPNKFHDNIELKNTESCFLNANKEPSRSSSFASNASSFSSSSSQVVDHHVAKPNQEMESSDIDKFEIMDSEFDVWRVLEYDEAKQEKQLEAFLLSSDITDEKYIIDHRLELAKKSEWYRYLQNSELGLEGIIGEDQQLPPSKTPQDDI